MKVIDNNSLKKTNSNKNNLKANLLLNKKHISIKELNFNPLSFFANHFHGTLLLTPKNPNNRQENTQKHKVNIESRLSKKVKLKPLISNNSQINIFPKCINFPSNHTPRGLFNLNISNSSLLLSNKIKYNKKIHNDYNSNYIHHNCLSDNRETSYSHNNTNKKNNNQILLSKKKKKNFIEEMVDKQAKKEGTHHLIYYHNYFFKDQIIKNKINDNKNRNKFHLIKRNFISLMNNTQKTQHLTSIKQEKK